MAGKKTKPAAGDGEISSLEDQIEKLQEVIENGSAANDSLVAEIDKLKDENQELADKVAGLTADLEQAAAEAGENVVNDEVVAEIANLKEQIENLQANNAAILADNDTLTNNLKKANLPILPEVPISNEVMILKSHKLAALATAEELAKATNKTLDDVQIALNCATRENASIKRTDENGGWLYETYSAIIGKWLNIEVVPPGK